MDAEQREPVEAASLQEQPTVIFDPAKLTAQLSELLELYLARAKEALLEEQMSSKEAVACAKQVAGMLDDAQSGKLAKVDTATHWPRLEFAPAAFVGRGPVPRRLASSMDNHGGPQVAALQNPPIQSLADAVSAVCQSDPETAILEPWALLLVRINKLTQRVAADVEAWKASCEESYSQPESRLSSRDSAGEESRLEDLPANLAGRDSSLVSTGEGGTGDPPVVSSNPEPIPPDGGSPSRVVQPFRAGSSGLKTRAKALDYQTVSASGSQPSASSRPSGAIRRRKTAGGQEAPCTRDSSLSGSGKLEAGSGYG